VSLTAARGPLGADPAGRFSSPLPKNLVFVEPHPRRIQALLSDDVVIDTESALMVHRVGRPLAYVFPADLIVDLPHEPEPEAPGYVHVPWDAVDTWIEEGRRLVSYPPNPYHRVDCRPTTRRLVVSIADTTLVDTDDTVVLFETSLEPKLYVNKSAVLADVLRPSSTTSYCNYKGESTYWSAHLDDVVVEDVAWSYEDPLPESQPISGFLSFDPTLVDVIATLPPAAG
jgi:uncharacterized protein (DUF427 family)